MSVLRHDAVRARKALNGSDVLGSDVGAIRIGFAKVPVKNGQENGTPEDSSALAQGIGDLSVGATIHALRGREHLQSLLNSRFLVALLRITGQTYF